MISKIKTRMASEEGFTLIELLVVIIILGILVAIAVPAYLSFAGSAKKAAAQANVRSAIPAAESYYQDTSGLNPTPGTYASISGAKLRSEAPGVSPNVKATPLNTTNGYCVEDTEPNGVVYDYIGGTPGVVTGAIGTIQAGTCLAEAGTAAA